MSNCERLIDKPEPIGNASVLEPCVGIFGDCRISHGSPCISEIVKGVYVPLVGVFSEPHWGVYDSHGRLVEEAAYKRGPGRVLIGQSERLEVSADLRVLADLQVSADLQVLADLDVVHEEMIYGGAMHAHFGHFLTAVLPRYWFDFAAHPERRILVHSGFDLELMFALDFVRDIFGALGLERSRFVALDRPSIVDRLIVPEALFQEQSAANPLFARLCEKISACLDASAPRTRGAAYLSKEKVTNGIWGVAEESHISAILAAKGVDIVYPERLPLREQIAVFERYETVCGLMGSALHASVFGRSGNRIVGLNHNTFIVSNHALIDRIKGNDAAYVHPRDGMTLLGRGGGFHALYECPNPTRVAEELFAMF